MTSLRTQMETTPTHIVDVAGGPTRCGLKKDDRFPVVYAPFVQAHIDGHGMTVCPECRKGGWPGRKRIIQRS